LIFVFSDCELDLDRFELRRAGRLRPVEPQVFDLLAVLIRERHRVVPKEELLDTVWGNRFVSESALTSRVKAARQAIGDDGRSQRFIRTAHGRGYQFAALVEEAAQPIRSPVHRRLRRNRRSGSPRPATAPGWPTRSAARACRW
jgi:DNA-binding winged helix-turn-helix (wHTH) protein